MDRFIIALPDTTAAKSLGKKLSEARSGLIVFLTADELAALKEMQLIPVPVLDPRNED